MSDSCNYRVLRTGDDVSALLDKIERLSNATPSRDGLMSAADKEKLDSLSHSEILYGSTSYWNSQIGFIPDAGTIIIYSDYSSIEIDGQSVEVPGIKIGSGNGYVQDLAFVGQEFAQLLFEHIYNHAIHVTEQQKLFWNNKLNVNDSQEVVGEILVFNRE